MDPLSLFILALYGTFVSFVQERFGAFQELPANVKQLINSILAFVIPLVVNFITPIWKPEFGDASEVVNAALLLAAPVVVWLVSQVAHGVDKKLIGASTQDQTKWTKRI